MMRKLFFLHALSFFCSYSAIADVRETVSGIPSGENDPNGLYSVSIIKHTNRRDSEIQPSKIVTSASAVIAADLGFERDSSIYSVTIVPELPKAATMFSGLNFDLILFTNHPPNSNGDVPGELRATVKKQDSEHLEKKFEFVKLLCQVK